MWVRGLKQKVNRPDGIADVVAPHVGAWIETEPHAGLPYAYPSHPMWVRGLKLEDSAGRKNAKAAQILYISLPNFNKRKAKMIALLKERFKYSTPVQLLIIALMT